MDGVVKIHLRLVAEAFVFEFSFEPEQLQQSQKLCAVCARSVI